MTPLPAPYYQRDNVTLFQGDCRDVAIPAVDAIVTDPPYDLTAVSRNGSRRFNDPDTPFGRHRLQSTGGFMGQAWDGTGVAFDPATWRVMFDALKPGGRLLAFGGTRTSHRMVCAIEDAGFVIEDSIAWMYGSGFPKHPSKLKPAYEPICVAWKPDKRATPLNIDDCRISHASLQDLEESEGKNQHTLYANPGSNRDSYSGDYPPRTDYDGSLGRWPANVALDEDAAAALDAQSGTITVPASYVRGKGVGNHIYGEGLGVKEVGTDMRGYGDTGGASRFFYCAKVSRSERDAGLHGMPGTHIWRLSGGEYAHNSGSSDSSKNGAHSHNHHPTVKPISLLQWLINLITPPGGTILDPFMGSGSTGCAAVALGYRFVGVELNPDYLDIAERRIRHWACQGRQTVMALDIPA